MKTIFNKTTRDGLIARIKKLNVTSTPQWGKMTVDQMLKHCILADEMYLGNKTYRRQFIGFVFGKIALKSMTKDESPMRKNSPTSADFIVTATGGNVEAEKAKWISVLDQYANYSNPEFVHWFFGKMTKEQVGYLAYKHTDHHLRQFNS